MAPLSPYSHQHLGVKWYLIVKWILFYWLLLKMNICHILHLFYFLLWKFLFDSFVIFTFVFFLLFSCRFTDIGFIFLTINSLSIIDIAKTSLQFIMVYFIRQNLCVYRQTHQSPLYLILFYKTHYFESLVSKAIHHLKVTEIFCWEFFNLTLQFYFSYFCLLCSLSLCMG